MGVSVGALARKVVTLKGESYGTWMENGWNMMENYGTLWKMMENDGK
jgi:hypothetical protein